MTFCMLTGSFGVTPAFGIGQTPRFTHGQLVYCSFPLQSQDDRPGNHRVALELIGAVPSYEGTAIDDGNSFYRTGVGHVCYSRNQALL